MAEPIEVKDSGGPRKPCIGWGSTSPMGMGIFEKYRDALP